jgi:hypothetical protein
MVEKLNMSRNVLSSSSSSSSNNVTSSPVFSFETQNASPSTLLETAGSSSPGEAVSDLQPDRVGAFDGSTVGLQHPPLHPDLHPGAIFTAATEDSAEETSGVDLTVVSDVPVIDELTDASLCLGLQHPPLHPDWHPDAVDLAVRELIEPTAAAVDGIQQLSGLLPDVTVTEEATAPSSRLDLQQPPLHPDLQPEPVGPEKAVVDEATRALLGMQPPP